MNSISKVLDLLPSKPRLVSVKRPLLILILALSVIALLATSKQASPSNYLLIISIDGLRPDALLKASTPNIDSLWGNGSYTWKAQTIMPSSTLPAHVSMLTGLTPERHGVTWNYWNPSKGYINAKTVFEIAHQKGLTTAMFVGKEKLKHIAKPGTVDFFRYPGRSLETVAKRAWQCITLKNPDLTFVHLPDPDSLGHQYGWLSAKQLESIEKADEAIGRIINVLEINGLTSQTTIIITSDHGGHEKTHGTDDPRDLTIPWIIAGPYVKSNHLINEKVRVYDTASTALYALGISIPSGWDGQIIKEAFQILESTGAKF